MHTVVHSVSRTILHIWHKNGTMKKSEYLERIRSLGSKTLHSTASTTGLVSKSGQSKHSVQMRQEFCKVKCSRISNVMSIHCRESCKRDDRLLNLVMGQRDLTLDFNSHSLSPLTLCRSLQLNDVCLLVNIVGH